MDNEQLFRVMAAELTELVESGEQFRLSLDAVSAFQLVAVLQLALRHPGIKESESANVARFVIESGLFFFSEFPSISEAIARGDNPAYDEPR